MLVLCNEQISNEEIFFIDLRRVESSFLCNKIYTNNNNNLFTFSASPFASSSPALESFFFFFCKFTFINKHILNIKRYQQTNFEIKTFRKSFLSKLYYSNVFFINLNIKFYLQWAFGFLVCLTISIFYLPFLFLFC